MHFPVEGFFLHSVWFPCFISLVALPRYWYVQTAIQLPSAEDGVVELQDAIFYEEQLFTLALQLRNDTGMDIFHLDLKPRRFTRLAVIVIVT